MTPSIGYVREFFILSHFGISSQYTSIKPTTIPKAANKPVVAGGLLPTSCRSAKKVNSNATQPVSSAVPSFPLEKSSAQKTYKETAQRADRQRSGTRERSGIAGKWFKAIEEIKPEPIYGGPVSPS